MRRTDSLLVPCLLTVLALADPASPVAAASRFRFGAGPATPRPIPASRGPSLPGGRLGVNDWGRCSPTLTPSVTQIAVQPWVVSDNASGAVVAWTDERTGKVTPYAIRLGTTGTPVSGWLANGNTVSVNDSSQLTVAACADGSGGGFFLTTDVDEDFVFFTDAYFQHLTSAGALASGYPAAGKTLVSGSVGVLGMQPDGSGGVFFGWSPDGSTIRIKRLDATGTVTGGWPAGGLDTGIPDAVSGKAAADGSGGIYFAYSTGTTVVVQRFVSSGVASGWPPAGVVVATPGSDVDPVIIRLSNGDALVSWVDPATTRVLAQRVDAAGAVDASWPAGGMQVTTSTNAQNFPEVLDDGAGGALILWQEIVTPPFGRLYMQHLTANGGLFGTWPAAGLSLLSTDTEYFASQLASDGLGGAIVAWFDFRNGNDTDVFAQRVLADKTIAWTPDGIQVCDAAGDQASPSIVSDGLNGAIVTWIDYQDSTNPQLQAARVLGDGTVPALASLADAEAEPGMVRLHWYTPDGSVSRATVERAEASSEFVALAEIEADGAGHLRYEDRDVRAGATYQYRLAVLDGTTTDYLGQVTIRVPAGVSFGGVRPNPAEGAMSVTFALESGSSARLEVLDVAGRRLLSQEVGMLGPGQHVLRLDKTASLPAGIYTVRLTQSGRVFTARAAIVR
jgi:hypothetical protein